MTATHATPAAEIGPPEADATAAHLRRELSDALIRPGIVIAPRNTILILTHDEADRLLGLIRAATTTP